MLKLFKSYFNKMKKLDLYQKYLIVSTIFSTFTFLFIIIIIPLVFFDVQNKKTLLFDMVEECKVNCLFLFFKMLYDLFLQTETLRLWKEARFNNYYELKKYHRLKRYLFEDPIVFPTSESPIPNQSETIQSSLRVANNSLDKFKKQFQQQKKIHPPSIQPKFHSPGDILTLNSYENQCNYNFNILKYIKI